MFLIGQILKFELKFANLNIKSPIIFLEKKLNLTSTKNIWVKKIEILKKV